MYQLVLCIFTYCLEIYLCWYSTNSFIFNYLTVSTFLFTNYWCYRNKHSCIFLFIHSERISLGCITKNRIALIRHGHFFLISLAITHNLWTNLDTFFKKGYLFLERGEGREKERERNINGCLFHAPDQGPGPQPRHVPWLGIEPVILWFAGPHSVHWATPARAIWTPVTLQNIAILLFKVLLSIYIVTMDELALLITTII